MTGETRGALKLAVAIVIVAAIVFGVQAYRGRFLQQPSGLIAKSDQGEVSITNEQVLRGLIAREVERLTKQPPQAPPAPAPTGGGPPK